MNNEYVEAQNQRLMQVLQEEKIAFEYEDVSDQIDAEEPVKLIQLLKGEDLLWIGWEGRGYTIEKPTDKEVVALDRGLTRLQVIEFING